MIIVVTMMHTQSIKYSNWTAIILTARASRPSNLRWATVTASTAAADDAAASTLSAVAVAIAAWLLCATDRRGEAVEMRMRSPSRSGLAARSL